MEPYCADERGSTPSVTIGMLLGAIAQARRLVGIITACAIAVALLVALLATPRYNATTIVTAPSPSAGIDELGEVGGQIGALGSLTGLGLGQRQDLDQTLVILQSQEFLQHFIDAEGVAPVLFPEHWDQVHKRWHPEHSLIGRLGTAMRRIRKSLSGGNLPQTPDDAPDPWSVFKRFSSLISVELDKRTHIVTLTIAWQDPVIAASWANDLVQRLNDEARARAVAEANARLVYVERQLNDTQVVELRQALYRTAEAEQKRAMIANTRNDYALRVLARALVPRERAFPKRTQLLIGGVIGGLMLGILVAIARALISGSIQGSGSSVLERGTAKRRAGGDA